MRRICAIAIIVFIVIALIFLGYALLKGEAREPEGYYVQDVWPRTGAAVKVPWIPEEDGCVIIENCDSSFRCEVEGCSEEYFRNYIKRCTDAGFTEEILEFTDDNGEIVYSAERYYDTDGNIDYARIRVIYVTWDSSLVVKAYV